jgi:cytochrome c553
MRLNTRGFRRALGVVILMSSCGVHLDLAEAADTGASPAAKAGTANRTAASRATGKLTAAKPAMPPAATPCTACHGATGAGMVEGDRPRIGGDSAYYIDKQLRDFANGSRESAVMGFIAKTLTDADRAQVVAYFASLPRPAALPGKPPTAAESARGHQLAIEGSEAQHVQACDNCHGPQGSGVPFSAPTLAGQLAPYLATQLKSWQQGTRKNDAGSLMSTVANRLSETDIAAVTAYYASLGSLTPGEK